MTDEPSTSSTTTRPPGRQRLLAESPRFADSFGLVLLLLVASYFVIAGAGDGTIGRVVSIVIFAATTWLALRAAQVKRHILRIALASSRWRPSSRPHSSSSAAKRRRAS